MAGEPISSELNSDQLRLLEQQVEATLMRHRQVTGCAVLFEGYPTDSARHCVQCGIIDTYPGLSFDDAGRCSLCDHYTKHKKEILAYFDQPAQLALRLRTSAEARGSEYDCLLLFSGGKDSTYVLYQLVSMGLRVMTFTFDNGFISRTALLNVDDITNDLGIEHITATRADQKRVFLQSLQEHKSVCNGCFRSLLDLSTELANERGIPTIVTGLSRGQIMDERLGWFHQQGIFDVTEIEEKLQAGRKIYHQSSATIAADTVDSVEVVDYFRYSGVTKEEIRQYLRERSSFWAQPTDTGFCSSNCLINDVGVYVHSAERGYHNYEAPTRWEVRLGHLDIAEADEELRTPVNTARVKGMLAKIGYPDPRDHANMGARMTAYYVSAGADLRTELPEAAAKMLPEALRPGRWVSVAGIPRTAGVTDRRALLAGRRIGLSGARAPDAAGLTTNAHTRQLTAAQLRILRDDPVAARVLLLTSDAGLDVLAVKKTTLRLLQKHTALQLRFVRHNGQWQQERRGVGGAVPVSRLDLSTCSAQEEAAVVQRVSGRLRDLLDVTDGPLLRIAVLDRGPRPASLLIAVHDLVADVSSWWLLVKDLSLGLNQLQRGEDVALPAAASFLPLIPERAPSRRPTPVAGGRCMLPPSTSEGPPLLGTCPAVSVDEVVAALAHELTACFGGDRVALTVADHSARADSGRAVGALTASERLCVEVDGTVSAAEPDEDISIRYEFFGDLATAVLPWRLKAGSVEEFIAPGALAGLLVTGVVEDCNLVLRWHCGDPLRGFLQDAQVPQRVAARLSAQPT